MNLGEKIKKLRGNMTQKELAQLSGVDESTISKIVLGKMTGTLKCHIKIAQALGTTVTELYKDLDEEVPETAELYTQPEVSTDYYVYNEKASLEMLTARAVKKRMLPVMVKLESGGKTLKEEIPRGSEKFIFCHEGKIEAIVGEKTYQLKKGDALYLNSSLPHYLKNTGKGQARCLWVSSPTTL